ncbi:hypothetical protein ACLQ2N_32945 [Streptomyces sp. DT224]|uniref:hypothetical protein n=1 Tax=Streptomyces sp. DT224 TaxID=3393426 RepID=UPI003CF601D3
MSRIRRTVEQIRAAAILAGLLALVALAVAAMIGAHSSTSSAPRPAATATVTPDKGQDATVNAYNAGWRAGVAALNNGAAQTPPDAMRADSSPEGAAWADGWVDGQADALGDDNRDGTVDESESGWDCRTMGNRVCGPAGRPGSDVAAVLARS